MIAGCTATAKYILPIDAKKDHLMITDDDKPTIKKQGDVLVGEANFMEDLLGQQHRRLIDNDTCSTATAIHIALGSTVTVSGTTAGASPESRAEFCEVGYTGSPAVWYKVIGTGGANSFETSGPGTLFNTNLSVYSGSCGSLAFVTGNGDANDCQFLASRTPAFLSVLGAAYFLLVHGSFISGVADSSGIFELIVTDRHLPISTCGPSVGLLGPSTKFPLRCCDPITGAVGPSCCGTTPYEPEVNACCGDEPLIAGTSDAACAPSGAPSSARSQIPSSFPSSEHTPPVTCHLGPVCDYEFTVVEDDESGGGIIVEEVYYAVCTEERNGRYRQECYPDSLVGSLGPGDVVDDDGRVIVGCGCCPDDTTGIKVKGSTGVCQGALDCFAEGADSVIKRVKKSASLKSVKVRFVWTEQLK